MPLGLTWNRPVSSQPFCLHKENVAKQLRYQCFTIHTSNDKQTIAGERVSHLAMSSSPFFTRTPMASEDGIKLIELANQELIIAILEIYEKNVSNFSEFPLEYLLISQYNVFNKLNSMNEGETILGIMDKLLHPVLNIKLGKFRVQKFPSFQLFFQISDILFKNDFNSFMMIISAFYGKNMALVDLENTNTGKWNTDQWVFSFEVSQTRVLRIEEKDLLVECHFPLHTLMVMCYAAHSMQKILMKDDFGQDVKTEKFKELKEWVAQNLETVIIWFQQTRGNRL